MKLEEQILVFQWALNTAVCPHREIGVKSNIKGISGIQLKVKKFYRN